MAAAVHAAGHIELDRADVVLVVQVFESIEDFLGDSD